MMEDPGRVIVECALTRAANQNPNPAEQDIKALVPGILEEVINHIGTLHGALGAMHRFTDWMYLQSGRRWHGQLLNELSIAVQSRASQGEPIPSTQDDERLEQIICQAICELLRQRVWTRA